MATPTFPPEIHSIIIRFATYDPVYFEVTPDPQNWPVDDERWCGVTTDYTTKKALALVSRPFRHISLPYLYESVDIHDSSSILILADVLDIASSDTATSGQQNPRKIENLFVSLSETYDQKEIFTFFNSLARVLAHCGGLKGFGLYEALPYRVDKPYNWWIHIPKGVRFVDWQGSIRFCDFTGMIDRISDSLIALRFTKFPHNTGNLPFVSLPKLTRLSIREGYGNIDFLDNWSMPSLTHLCVNMVMSDALMRFIERAGNSLCSVILGHRANAPTLISHIPTVAPTLEEYTYHLDGNMEMSWALVGSHPSLQSILVVGDAFGPYGYPMSTFCKHFRPLTGANFPELRRIGFIGLDPYDNSFNPNIRALVDELLDSWNESGIDVEYLGR